MWEVLAEKIQVLLDSVEEREKAYRGRTSFYFQDDGLGICGSGMLKYLSGDKQTEHKINAADAEL